MIVASHRDDTPPELLDKMHRLRAKSFAIRRKWRVAVEDGYEIDHFDDLNPLYIMVLDESGDTLLASARLLPTTGPHMLSDVFQEIVEDEPVIRHPRIMESTRFCVDTDACLEFGENGINHATSELVLALCNIGREANLINIISVFDILLLRILKRCGCRMTQYGKMVSYDQNLKTIAAIFELDIEAEQEIRTKTGNMSQLQYSGAFAEQLTLN